MSFAGDDRLIRYRFVGVASEGSGDFIRALNLNTHPGPAIMSFTIGYEFQPEISIPCIHPVAERP